MLGYETYESFTKILKVKYNVIEWMNKNPDFEKLTIFCAHLKVKSFTKLIAY